MIRLAVAGAGGRMGGALVRAIVRTDGVELTAALEHPASAAVGKDAGAIAGCGEVGVAVRSGVTVAGVTAAGATAAGVANTDATIAGVVDADVTAADVTESGVTAADATDPVATETNSTTAAPPVVDFDLLIEFTTPAATLAHVAECRRVRRGMVIGTTGIDAHGEDLIRQAARDIPIVLAANTSVGINLCLALLETAGQVLGPLTDVEIIEAHHRHKVDAPSGTALLLAQAVAKPLGTDIVADGVYARHGHTGARKSGAIGFSTIRGGDIAGEHTVMFIGDGERVEITHRATDRKIFADGALVAAKWLANQPPGLYRMRDVLGLHGDG